ncbi:MAG: hypothetical protein K6A38_00955 [Lachnospiraceae bacterium]|nr:hypothetical protein [Lachnospiraceae bacterium]
MNIKRSGKIVLSIIAGAVCILVAAYLWIYNGVHYHNKDELAQTVSEYQVFEMLDGEELSIPLLPEKNYVQSISVLLINLESEESGNMTVSILDKYGKKYFDTSIPLSSVPAGEFYEFPVYTRLTRNREYLINISQKGASVAPYLLYADSSQIKNGADPLVGIKYCNEASDWEKSGIMISVILGLLTVLIFCFGSDISKFLSRSYTKIILGILLLTQYIMMMPMFKYVLGSVTLDPSWRYVLNILGYRGYKFGDDAFFTYGPLGFICYLMNLDNNGITYYVGLAVLLIVVFINAYFLFKVFKLVFQNKISIVGVVLSSLVYILNYTKSEWDNYMLYTLILGVIVSFRERHESKDRTEDKNDRSHIVTIVAVNFLFCIMSLSKFSTFTSALSFTILFAIFDFFFNRRIESISYFAPACAFSVIGYLLYNPSFADLFRYLKGIFAISDGWMISSQWDYCFTQKEWQSLILIMIMFVLLMVTGIICDHKSSHIIISLSSSMFLLFKYASTRHGLACGLWLYAMLFSAAVLSFNWDVLFDKESNDRSTQRSVCIRIAGLFAIACVSFTSILQTTNLHYSTGEIKAQLHDKFFGIIHINDPSVLPETIESSTLPEELLAKIGSESVCIYNYRQAMGATNPSLNLKVYPSIQGVLTIVPMMEQRNTYFFNSEDAPTYMIMFDETIDDRIKLFDSPYTWDGIRTNYQVDSVYGDITLLKKVNTGKPKDEITDEYTFLREESYDKDAVIEIPHDAKYAKVKIDFSLTGKLKKFFYHVFITNVSINYSDGRVLYGRAIIPTLEEGFEITYFPQNPGEMIQKLGYVGQDDKDNGPDMVSISFSGLGLNDIADKIKIKWYG